MGFNLNHQNDETEFLLEKKLYQNESELSMRYRNNLPILDVMLEKFFNHFPNFTDHSLLHSMSIIHITNQLIGLEHLDALNEDAIYIYLMATLLHDCGMGIRESDLNQFMAFMGFPSGEEILDEDIPEVIRKYHQKISAGFVMKYWQILDIPDEKYALAIARLCNGHRVADLFDLENYPVDYEIRDGVTVNLAGLAALLRLADELDIASDRNPDIIYAEKLMKNNNERSLVEFARHEAIHNVLFQADTHTITVCAQSEDPALKVAIEDCVAEVRKKMDYGRRVMTARGGLLYDYDTVEIEWE